MAKPKNPPSAYNIFFQVERKRILAGTDHLCLPISPSEIRAVLQARKSQPKRKHRKSHGLISFRALSQKIASKWRQIDRASLVVLTREADYEKQQYRAELKKWQDSQRSAPSQTTELPTPTTYLSIGNLDKKVAVREDASQGIRSVSPGGAQDQQDQHIGDTLLRDPSPQDEDYDLLQGFEFKKFQWVDDASTDPEPGHANPTCEMGQCIPTPTDEDEPSMDLSLLHMRRSSMFIQALSWGVDLTSPIDANTMEQLFD